jgi:hypothetical protein
LTLFKNSKSVEGLLSNRNTLSKFVKSAEGKTTQRKFWGELADKLDSIEPGVVAKAGLSSSSEGLYEVASEN